MNHLISLYTNRYKKLILQIDVIKRNKDEKIGDLSGGNRRLVEALLMIYSDSQFILLDEPFSQLAPIVTEELKTHILNFKDEKGFIIADHYYEQILAISDRIVLIHNGSNYAINDELDLKRHGYLPFKE
ncbi:MAG: hypothetical protein EOO07_15900 [Chitinophagaceae bacterium]|nr:MAG: hypothetical protein EOO07_15900 [Chitinophagaceae bacterium]